ncbi:hypothetical protein SB756_33320, partial [Pseudomonas sp. SIMBA_068]
MKNTLSIALALSALALVSAAQAQNAPEPAEEQWQELPRNTTIYVPVPAPIAPLSALRSCSGRYERAR